jgi:Cu2+-containing amine oxidase
MNDIEALVSLTVGVVPSRHRWQDVHPALRCETFVARANAVDNNPAWQAVNGHAWVITSAPLNDEDKDYND